MIFRRAALIAIAIGLSASNYARAEQTPAATSADQTAPATSGAQNAGTPGTAAALPVAAPQAERLATAEAKGHIVFFRPVRLPGALHTYHIVEVGDDGKPAKDAPRLGDLRNGGAFGYDADPGIHSYNITGPMAVVKDEDRLRLEVEPGQTYYIEQAVRIGLVTGGFRLVPADEARFHASNTKLSAEK